MTLSALLINEMEIFSTCLMKVRVMFLDKRKLQYGEVRFPVALCHSFEPLFKETLVDLVGGDVMRFNVDAFLQENVTKVVNNIL